MKTLTEYKNLFLHPRKFAKNRLKTSWPWWAYLLAILGWNIAILATSQIFYVEFGQAAIAQGISLVLSIVVIFVINQPFRKKLSIKEYYTANLAFQAYAAPLYFLISLLVRYALTSLLFVGIIMLISGIAMVWITTAYCKFISELHKASAWKVFGMVVLTGILITIIEFVIPSQQIKLPELGDADEPVLDLGELTYEEIVPLIADLCEIEAKDKPQPDVEIGKCLMEAANNIKDNEELEGLDEALCEEVPETSDGNVTPEACLAMLG